MVSADGPASRAPFTIPLAQGPVAPWLDRTAAAVFAAMAIGAFVLLWPTQPAAKGYDTHVQLGLQPCGWPDLYGIPCPTCGCTTAASHVVHGELLQAFVAQPFGAALAIGGLLLGAHGLLCLLRGRSFVDLLVRLPFWRILTGGFVLALLAWYYKYLVWHP